MRLGTAVPKPMKTPTPPVTLPDSWVPLRPGLIRLEQGRAYVVAGRCRSCGAHYFPARKVCARCLTDAMEEVPLSSRGRIYTYTVIHQSVPGFEVPYVLAYVDLPEGLRVLGQVAGCAPEQVTVGMPVELSVEPVGSKADGTPVVAYRFRPG